ncbi:MAG: InlB B-repeat-containing protein, partial [candidate division KSB1 bacterium]|nr:InlB B-repeat-containing protein [candidate division KSB1 bacterium]
MFRSIIWLLLPVAVYSQTHFTPPTSNYQPMNIYIISARINGNNLVAGDEIAVFDASTCAGMTVLDHPASSSNPVSIVAYKAHGSDTGFREGYPITFKCWMTSYGVEHTFTSSEVQFYDPATGNPIGPKNFEGLGSVMVSLNGTHAITSYTLTMQAGTGGSTSPAPGTYSYAVNTVVNIQALPSPGYQFDYWEGPVADPNSASTTVLMNANKTVKANFRCVQYTLTLAVSPTGSGTTSPAVGSHSFCQGSEVTITATPSPGYEFVNWTGDVTNPNSATTTVFINSNKTVTANFRDISVTNFTLTMQVNQTGWGTTTPPIGNNTYPAGTVVTITANPASGYRFVNWTGDVANPNSATTTVTLNSNKTVMANFERLQYTLTMEVNEAGWGTTTPPIGTHNYNSGDIISILATPNSGYRFVSWTGEVANPTSASTTVIMNANKTVRANFERIQYTLTVEAGTGGSTSPSPGTYTFYSGDIVSLTAIPNSGYSFVRWEGDVTNPNSISTTVIMNASKTVRATFAVSGNYPLTINISPAGGGTTNPPAGTTSYPPGTVVTVTATPNPGYTFVNWTGDVSSSNATISVTMNSAKTITANFTSSTQPQFTLTMQVNQSAWGTTDPAVGNHQYTQNSTVTIRALPATGYRFVNWTGPVANTTANPTTVYMDGNKTVTANFEPVPRYTLTIQTDPAGGVGGTTSPPPGSIEYDANTLVTLQAFPSNGYRFDRWQGDVASTTSPTTTILMTGNKTVIAFFTAIPRYTITVLPPDDPNQGYTDPAAGSYVLNQNESMTLRAFARSGYRFRNWNNNPSLTSATITVVADANKSYKPFFDPVTDVRLTMEVNDPAKGNVFPAVGTHTYPQGQEVTIEAFPAAGYRFVEWQIDGVRNAYFNPRMTLTMDRNRTARAIFDNIIYRLIMDVSPAGGGTTTPPVGTNTYKSFSTVNISAVPAAGFKFVGWTGPVADPSSANTTVYIDGDKNVRANFARVDRYTLNINVTPTGGGTTNPPVGVHEYDLNQVVTLTATPAPGYVFQEWQGDVANPTSPTTTITINGNKNVTAVFRQLPPTTYQLTILVNPTSGGTTVPAPATYTYPAGQVVTVQAVPAANYHFVNWSGDVADPFLLTTTVTMNGNKTIIANFAPGAAQYRLTIDINPVGSGSTVPAAGTYYYAQGTLVNLQAIPAPGYEFAYWTGDVANPSSPTTTILINGDKSIIAHFRTASPRYTLTLAVSPAGGGTTMPAAGQYQYDAGVVVAVQAFPANGFEFVNWSGPVTDPNSAATTIVMDGNKQVTANFRQKPNQVLLTMMVDPVGGGNTGPEPGVHVFGLNEKIYITAVANRGYHFSHWTGDVNDPERPTTFIVMNSNKTVIAHGVAGPPGSVQSTIRVNPDGSGSTQPAAGVYTYPYGAVVTLKATPATGYRFVGWSGGVDSPLSSTTSITLRDDVTVYANFERIGSGQTVLSMNVSPVGAGTTSPPPGISLHAPGEVVNISAIPYEGYTFAGWHGEVEDSTQQTTQVVVDKNKEVYAKFVRGQGRKFNLTMIVYPPNAGLCAPPEGTHSFDENTYVNIAAIPNPGWVFKNWTGDVETPTAQSTRILMTGNKTVIAQFERVAPNQVTLTMIVNPPEGGTTQPAAGSYAYDLGQVVTLTATPRSGYRFVGWSGDVADPTSPTTTITMTANKTVIANFQASRFTITMRVNPPNSGTTTPAVGDTTVEAGATVTFTATPASGYRFAYWSGDLSGSESPTTMRVDKNLQIVANFIPLEETVSTPRIFAPTSAFRRQRVDFFVRNAASSLGHDLEYQFEWGDGTTSPWVDLSAQRSEKITTYTSPVGGSGLPSSGPLVNYATGEALSVRLSISGGIYAGRQEAWAGEEPAENTDAGEVFGNILNCRGAISYIDTPNDELVLEFSNLNPLRSYLVVFYSNRNEFGWLRGSIVTLNGAESFVNLSSAGKDDMGNPLFSGPQSPNTRLPADNTATGYVAKFGNIVPGSDGKFHLTVRFGGKSGQEYKGKYGSAVMLQEINPLTQQATFTAYNDLAWDGGYYSHAYAASGSYLVRVRARCKSHTSAVSSWSNAHSVLISGCVLTTAITEGSDGSLVRM